MSRRTRERRALGLAAMLQLLALPACTVGPDYVRPDAPTAPTYTTGAEPARTRPADGKAQVFDAGVQVPANWWSLFNSPKLDPILAAALERNLTWQAAQASLRQSQQNLQAGEGIYYPQVDATLDVSRQKANPVSFGVDVPPSIFNLFTLSASVSYALDLFGANRRAVEGLRAQVDASRYAALATYLALTGNLVNTVIARAAYEEEIAATRAILRAQREEVELTRASVKSGTAAYSSLLSLQAQLATTEATLPPLSQRLNQADHLLAVLSGKLPAEWSPPAIALADLTLPETLPKSLPSELVRQRPDILETEAVLHVASAQVGVATAALYPSLTINARLGLNGSSASELLKTRNSFWDFGADILAPLFRGGTLRAQKRAALEAFQAALADYRQTVLGGIQQVADAMRALEHDAELVSAQTEALASASEALKLTQASYRAGTVGYLQLMTAEIQSSQARIGSVQGVAQRYQDTVALFVALGGGWWNSARPEIQGLKPAQ